MMTEQKMHRPVMKTSRIYHELGKVSSGYVNIRMTLKTSFVCYETFYWALKSVLSEDVFLNSAEMGGCLMALTGMMDSKIDITVKSDTEIGAIKKVLDCIEKLEYPIENIEISSFEEADSFLKQKGIKS